MVFHPAVMYNREMTILERNIIDFMGMSKDMSKMVLTISDHLPWSDYELHSMALQDKITDYLEYVYTSRQRLEVAAKAIQEKDTVSVKDRRIPQAVEIQLMMKYEPTPEGNDLLQRIKSELDQLGFAFTYQVFSEISEHTHNTE